ncbi:hypothetical protein BJV78DRAFT_1282840 [Lactifluus subvellereus]|nr:hypothetical protein BJV78DRAFT_1282840 [Lactifluus subvellereus]
MAQFSPYASLTITQKPSWVRDPATYQNGASSSLSMSFEDPDSTDAQTLLCQCTLYAFGHVITVKCWKQTPPKCTTSISTTSTPPPLSTAVGLNPPTGEQSHPPVYTSPTPAPNWAPAQTRSNQPQAEKHLLYDAEGILVFTGLFSAAVVASVAVTVQDLKQNS